VYLVFENLIEINKHIIFLNIVLYDNFIPKILNVIFHEHYRQISGIDRGSGHMLYLACLETGVTDTQQNDCVERFQMFVDSLPQKIATREAQRVQRANKRAHLPH